MGEQTPVYDASQIQVLQEADVQRVRPRMYFGAERDDPMLPLGVLIHVVEDAVGERPVGPVLTVRVVVEGDLCFRVEDDGPGLPTAPTGGTFDPAPMVVRVFESSNSAPRGGLGVGTAMCSQVTAAVRRDGHCYHVDAGPYRRASLTDLGPAEGHGTSVRFVLDEDYLPEGAALPLDPAPSIAAALTAPAPFGRNRTLGRTDLVVHDERTGSRTHLTVLPRGVRRCPDCYFAPDAPLAAPRAW
ncbi:ATP-binding protein [Yinghuangia seranimata]|uniref:ATP-binding protein n=1 Tax=Yinghuangia seranimata TaxID=408067 RepID=UPI00248AF932|nr:ATP-binding protein [Yinghuangia seranimata]MDI2124595.1 ATP-binding protein [Yinghuangia seranimata]